jgi:hypothetical protein
MYIEAGPNRNSSPAFLLRKTYREDGRVKKRTLLNLESLARQLWSRGGLLRDPGGGAQ